MSPSRNGDTALRRLIVACDALDHEPSPDEIQALASASGESVMVVAIILETRAERAAMRTWPIGNSRKGNRWAADEDAVLSGAWRNGGRSSESEAADLDARLAKRLTNLAINRERGIVRTPGNVRERRRWAWWLRQE